MEIYFTEGFGWEAPAREDREPGQGLTPAAISDTLSVHRVSHSEPSFLIRNYEFGIRN